MYFSEIWDCDEGGPDTADADEPERRPPALGDAAVHHQVGPDARGAHAGALPARHPAERSSHRRQSLVIKEHLPTPYHPFPPEVESYMGWWGSLSARHPAERSSHRWQSLVIKEHLPTPYHPFPPEVESYMGWWGSLSARHPAERSSHRWQSLVIKEHLPTPYHPFPPEVQSYMGGWGSPSTTSSWKELSSPTITGN